ncbi:MAG: metallophosphoesterase, partial [Planctomycetota bacterium]
PRPDPCVVDGERPLAPKYYFVSDLHMGGDGQLQLCDYAPEFVAFLKELANESPDTELLIAGDTFGFWELTLVQGVAKITHIIEAHQGIFDQLKATGARIKITMLVGNHDYDLACDPGFAVELRKYNIHLDTNIALIRTMGDKKIWIEHGQQHDNFNAFPEYGDPYALPVGYFITRTFVSGASRHSDFGHGNWLKDIRSVDTMQIPDWIWSNYFYREMSMVFRWLLVPFLLLFGLELLALGGEALRLLGIFDYNVLFHNPVMERLGIVNNMLQVVVTINSFFLLVIGVPMLLVLRDLRKTLHRFRLHTDQGAGPDLSDAPYRSAALDVFAKDDKVAVFIFGHTHGAFLEPLGPKGQIVINTGTWLKLLQRSPARIGYFPAVYVPSFRLNYFKIQQVGKQMEITYVEVAKKPERELTWLQKLVTFGKSAKPHAAIPAKTLIDL